MRFLGARFHEDGRSTNPVAHAANDSSAWSVSDCRLLISLRDCRRNGVSGSTAQMGRRSHDDRHTGGHESTGTGWSRRR